MPDVVDDVIQGLYEAATGVLPWRQVLGRWHAVAAPAFAVQLVVIEPDLGGLLLSEASPQSPPEAIREHAQQWHRSSPHIPHLLARPTGELMHSADRFPPERYASHPFYSGFWARYGIRSMVAAKVAQTAQSACLVAISRTNEQPPFTASDLLLMQRLVTHLVAAMRLAEQLQPMQHAALVGHGLQQASPRPMLLIDGQLRLRGSNPSGDQWLAGSPVLRVSEGRLQGLDPDATAELERALERIDLRASDATAVDSAGPSPAPPTRTALRLSVPDGEPLLASLAPLRAADGLGAHPASGLALLTLQTEPQADDIDGSWLGAMFNLTPAEVAVAAQLMRGLEAKQIARANHRSLHTVRSQMRSLLHKTGSRRQADLVRVLMRAASL